MGRNRTLPIDAVQLTVHLPQKYVDALDAVRRKVLTGKEAPRTQILRMACELGLEQLAQEMGIDIPDDTED